MKKTNAIRLLEQAGIDYEARMYPVDESDLSGTHAAAVLGLPAGQVFKTLVLRGAKTGYFVCCNPVGMKKKFPTFFDASAQKWERISVSAGTRGEMVLVEPEQLRELTSAVYTELTL